LLPLHLTGWSKAEPLVLQVFRGHDPAGGSARQKTGEMTSGILERALQGSEMALRDQIFCGLTVI